MAGALARIRSPLTAAGIYPGIPMEDYHSTDLCDVPSVSSSHLRKIVGSSPAHYWATSPYNPNAAPEGEKPHFSFGRAAHHLILGEKDFRSEYALRPERWDSWRTNASKEWRDDQEAAGFTVVTPDDLVVIKGMAAAMAADPIVKQGVLNGKIEQTLIAPSAIPGIMLKARPDVMPTDSGDYVDFKTTHSVTDDAIEQALGDLGYHMQGALVAECSQKVFNAELNSFSLVFAEKKYPYCIRTVELRPDDLARGFKLNQVALRVFAYGLESGEWPGPGDGHIVHLSPKPWQMKKEDDYLQAMESFVQMVDGTYL